MSKLSEAKILGGIGALLILIGGVVSFFALIGLILLFIAVKYVANESKDNSIFDNFLMHFIFNIIAIFGFAIIAFISLGGFSFISIVQKTTITDFESFWNFFKPYMLGIFIALLFGWVMLSIGAFYLRKCYNNIALKTKVDLFRTTGIMYFIGAVTLIILVGFLILIIAKILEIVSFFSLPEKLQDTI